LRANEEVAFVRSQLKEELNVPDWNRAARDELHKMCFGLERHLHTTIVARNQWREVAKDVAQDSQFAYRFGHDLDELKEAHKKLQSHHAAVVAESTEMLEDLLSWILKSPAETRIAALIERLQES
jgi:hypothetical protein